ncbi:hypothetical protein, partial [Hymenobacter agri]
MKTAFLCTAASLLLASAAAAQTTSVAGLWQGSLKPAPNAELKAFFELQGAAPALTGTMSVPQQSGKAIALSSVVVRHDSLLLAVEALHGRFAGKLSADGQQAVGTWYQGGAQLPLTLQR